VCVATDQESAGFWGSQLTLTYNGVHLTPRETPKSLGLPISGAVVAVDIFQVGLSLSCYNPSRVVVTIARPI
jgi:hypothetical protein